MTNLKDLAVALDLSITQVSRALDDKPDVSAKTKVRVREMARKMGYFPNAAARSLRKQRADVIAVILPSGANHMGLGALLDMLYETATHLGKLGYDLVMVPGLSADGELDVMKRIVDGRRADALVVVRTRRHDERIAFLAERGVPFVLHGRTDEGQAHAFVDGDGEAGFADATRWLAGLGHRRIAHLAGPTDMYFGHLRRTGWARAMAELDAGPLVEASAQPTEQGGYAAAATVLAGKDRPTALLCATDAMAIGAYRAIRERGLEPGRDISVVGHDNLAVGTLTSPRLSTMELATGEVGKRLATALHRRLGGADPRDLQEIVPIRQIPRDSHAPLQIGRK